jgi:hypothetical protein
MVLIQVNPNATTPQRIEEEKKKLVEIVQQAKSDGKLQINSLYWQEYGGPSVAGMDCPMNLLWGEEFIHENILGLK